MCLSEKSLASKIHSEANNECLGMVSKPKALKELTDSLRTIARTEDAESRPEETDTRQIETTSYP